MVQNASARQKAAAAGDDIRVALLQTLAAHGVEFAQVARLEHMVAGEFALTFIVYDRAEIRPECVESTRIGNQIDLPSARQTAQHDPEGGN